MVLKIFILCDIGMKYDPRHIHNKFLARTFGSHKHDEHRDQEVLYLAVNGVFAWVTSLSFISSAPDKGHIHRLP